MRKTTKQRLLAGIMAGIVAAGTLTGCSGGSKKEETSAAAGSEAVESSASTVTEEDKASWVSDTPVEISIMMMDNANQAIKADAPAHKEIEKKTNVKLDFQVVPSSSYKDKKNILLGTNNFPDLIYLQSTEDVVTYASSGIFEPLMQYVNEETMPNFYKFWQQYPEMEKYLVDGELYVFPVIAREETANGYGPVIRTDLLEKNNLPIPQTFDELLDSLIQLKEIYPDSIPWATRKGTSHLLDTTAYMLGSGHGKTGIYYDFDEEKYVFGPASENFKSVLEFLNRAYESGVLDPEFATATAEQMESKLSSGKSFFFIDNSGFGQNYTKALRKIDGNQDAVMQIIPIPENSFGQRRAMAYASELPGRFYAMNAGAKNKEEIIKFIDWMYSKEGSDISNYGVEGVSFEYDENGEPQFIKDYVMQFKDSSPSDYYAVYADMGITKLDWSLWACNTKTWFEIQKLDGNWDEVADEYWNIVGTDEAYVQPAINPAMTKEETERIQDIMADLTTYLEQEYNKYIMGEEEIANWDQVITHCEELGARELEQIYNDANARGAQ